MDVEVIPDDDVTWLESWGKLCSDVSVELVAIHRSIDDEGRGDRVASQPGDEGLRVPLAEGSIGVKALAHFAPAAQRRHVGLDGRFIDEDETARALSHRWLAILEPLIALLAHIGAFAFRRHQRFF